MSNELVNKLRVQKKFRNLKAIQKLLENATQVEEYLSGQAQPYSDNIDTLPANGFTHVDKDLHYHFETNPTINGTRVTEIRSSDIQLLTSIEDNFFYQHMFNFALVVILLLQVIVVWAFIWCRLSKIGNQTITNQSQVHGEEGMIALREVAELPELIPYHHVHDRMGDDEMGANIAGHGVHAANRIGRHG